MKEIMRVHFQELPSTNDYAKSQRVYGRDLLITATCQSGGRGTKGRSFSSNEGGVYLSKLCFYENFSAKNAFQIMAGAAVAVCETLSVFGLSPKIKWANDVFVGRKKICGILIENVFSGENIASSVVGVGINVWNRLEKELLNIATTMEIESGKRYAVEEVTKVLIDNLSKEFSMEDYRRYLGFMGERVTLLVGDERVPATLLSVTNEGMLEVDIAGEYKKLSAAEVSLRV